MKYLRVVAMVVALGIAIGIIITILSNIKDSPKDEVEYITTAHIRDGNDTWEVRVDTVSGNKYIYKNGEEVEVIMSLRSVSVLPYMKLPDIDESDDKINIEDGEELQIITWASDLKTSASYLNYLKGEGFTEVRYAATQNYIEVYMEHKETLKRIIILRDTIMTADVDKKELPSIENYYK